MNNDYQMRVDPTKEAVDKMLDLGYKIIAIHHGAKVISKGGMVINTEAQVFMHFLKKGEEKSE